MSWIGIYHTSKSKSVRIDLNIRFTIPVAKSIIEIFFTTVVHIACFTAQPAASTCVKSINLCNILHTHNRPIRSLHKKWSFCVSFGIRSLINRAICRRILDSTIALQIVIIFHLRRQKIITLLVFHWKVRYVPSKIILYNGRSRSRRLLLWVYCIVSTIASHKTVVVCSQLGIYTKYIIRIWSSWS